MVGTVLPLQGEHTPSLNSLGSQASQAVLLAVTLPNPATQGLQTHNLVLLSTTYSMPAGHAPLAHEVKPSPSLPPKNSLQVQ